MPTRVFLGWDRPFLERAVGWFDSIRERLPGMLVVVPTTGSGRRLREALAAAAGGVLSPRFVTPGSLMKVEERVEAVAEDWVEQLAWLEVLEGIGDWSEYQGLFPEGHGEDGIGIEPGWADGMSRELVRLRRTLQEVGLLLSGAARLMQGGVEEGRWADLARLEEMVEAKLADWGHVSRSAALAAGVGLPGGVEEIVLAGVVEMPPLVARAFERAGVPVTVLVGAPEEEAEGFSGLGVPKEGWQGWEALPWPEGERGSVRVVADPRQQAVEALGWIAKRGAASSEVAVGAADLAVGGELVRVLGRDGWPAFHPAAPVATCGLRRWFAVWARWQDDGGLGVVGELLALPQAERLVERDRGVLARGLALLRGRWMVLSLADIERRVAVGDFRNGEEREAAQAALAAVRELDRWRLRMAGAGLEGGLREMLCLLGGRGGADAEMGLAMVEWLDRAVGLIGRLKRRPAFWVDLMVAAVPAPQPQPPEGRVIDIQGWLELFYEPGKHLVMCGMNEGCVPARGGGEPWLGEAARAKLGLAAEGQRVTRDAYLFRAMVASRAGWGWVDVFCGKVGGGGEPLLPSRLLLAGGEDELPGRVAVLFREIEPPDAGLRRGNEWKWRPRVVVPTGRVSVTALTDYLRCPFRYYLKHVVRMVDPETARLEWNARDFGTVAHEVLERWGRDGEARDFSKSEELGDWFSGELERVVDDWFGKKRPLAVRIQVESLRQRFGWLAKQQAVMRADGWEVRMVEQKVGVALQGGELTAKIDRLDYHPGRGIWRMIDYKTGKMDGVEKAHRSKLTASSTLAGHAGRDTPVVHRVAGAKGMETYVWRNLQLPVYVWLVRETGLLGNSSILPIPCYFTLGDTVKRVELTEWSGFSQLDMEMARDCAGWILSQVAAGVFWPPAERVDYDDYAVLGAGGVLGGAVEGPERWV